MGYYRGNGARLIASFRPSSYSSSVPSEQPPCLEEEATGLFDCRNWKVNAQWTIPTTSVSGLYFARFVREDQVFPAHTWRTDASTLGLDPKFAVPGASLGQRPEPMAHSYGALGYGKLRNPLKEPRASHAFFVVRAATPLNRNEPVSEILFQTSDATWQTYNTFAGVNRTSHQFLTGRSTYGSLDPANPRYFSLPNFQMHPWPCQLLHRLYF